MDASNICQSHLDLNAQNGIASYDINSLVDDDFEVIGSLSDTLRSVSLETSSEIPFYDIEIGNRNGTITENSSSATSAIATTNREVDASTPLANSSLNLMSGGDTGRNTDILTQSIIKSSLIDSTNLSMHPFHEDPINTVESIRADYQAAQQSAKQENDLLRKACEKKNEQINEEIVQKIQLSAELEETQRVLSECRIKVDEEVASKIEREDIIKVLQTTIAQLQSNGDLSCLGSSVINEQALVSSLHEKEELIEALKKQLEGAEERYEREHKEVLDLEEIVKVSLCDFETRFSTL
uniref:TACC_C domain-containing protein n=1 Tax=Elaeophora elaphi TaxID=1147741 RepID=A0A0R3RLG3_9BILA